MIRDRDRIYGTVVTRRLRAMGIRDKPTPLASPWQNGFAERLIGSIRRDCFDHSIVLGEAHLRKILQSYARYYEPIDHWIRCADFSPGSAKRCDQFTRHPGRTSSPLRPCLSFRYTQAEILVLRQQINVLRHANPTSCYIADYGRDDCKQDQDVACWQIVFAKVGCDGSSGCVFD
jgi:hypothetical protein